MYSRSPFIFANEVRKINNRISQEEPLENMVDEINYITHKFNIFNTKIKSSAFTALQNLKDTISYKNELKSIQSSYTDTSNTLIQSKQDLEIALKDLEDCQKLCNINGSVRTGFKIKDVALVVDTTFKKEYLIY